jgi:hypothetical protein
VNYIRKSVLDTETLVKCVGFRIPAMNNTRWSSQYNMLNKLMEAIEKDPTLQSKLNATKKLNKLTAYEINTLKELVALLKPFKVATDELQGDFETVGNVIPAYLGLLMASKHWTSPLTKNVAKALETSLVNRLSYVLNESCYVLGNYFGLMCLRNK